MTTFSRKVEVDFELIAARLPPCLPACLAEYYSFSCTMFELELNRNSVTPSATNVWNRLMGGCESPRKLEGWSMEEGN